MIYEKISEMLAKALDCSVSDITPESTFEDLGIDSLDIAELIMKIEDEFGIELEMDETLKKVSDLVVKIEEKQEK